jgi:hypothetical protein
MLAHLLEQDGIPAYVHGEALQGAMGELPAGGLIQLMVAEEHYERARQLLLQWEKASAPADAESPRPGGRFRVVAAIVFLAAGMVCGWALKVALDNSSLTFADSAWTADQNGDDRPDASWFYRPGAGQPYKGEFDSNFDGRADVIARYDSGGAQTVEESDRNFDGVFETRDEFRDGVRSRGEVDTDRNEIVDMVQVFEHGILRREEFTDHRYGFVVRINHYEAHQLSSSEVDLNRDGFLETVRTYDRFGEVSETETRSRP